MLKVGQRLREERLKKDLTLEEVSKATKIKVPFLVAIEKGEYEKLPSSTYAQGFIKNYAGFLGLPEHELMAIFRREYDEEKAVKVLPVGLPKREEFPIRRIRFQQTAKIIIFLFLVLLAYIIFQYRYAIINPPLTVSIPMEGAILSTQKISVLGKTDPNASIFVNNEPVSLDSNGNFKKTITLFTGKTVISIKAVNSFGKETITERHVEVKDNAN